MLLKIADSFFECRALFHPRHTPEGEIMTFNLALRLSQIHGDNDFTHDLYLRFNHHNDKTTEAVVALSKLVYNDCTNCIISGQCIDINLILNTRLADSNTLRILADSVDSKPLYEWIGNPRFE